MTNAGGQPGRLVDRPSAAAVRAGAARRDITPPVGIYNRNWGAARHDTAQGIHRPLSVTALAISSDAATGDEQRPLVLVSVDAGWYRCAESEWAIRGRVLEALQLPVENLMIALTHTHAACSLSASESHKPGGELIPPYIEKVIGAIIEASLSAIDAQQAAVITMATGRCTLAANRDLPDPDVLRSRHVTGYNPSGAADDTLLVGRVTMRDVPNRVIATLVNYACHPTTLAWQNSLISPDYIGAMRETVEEATAEAPCLFVQGASGELAPREQYTGDVGVADAHGRELGASVLATLESMLPPCIGLEYDRTVESGAPLGVWARQPFEPAKTINAIRFDVTHKLKDDLPSLQQISSDIEAADDPVMAERLHRKLQVRKLVGDGDSTARPVWLWQLGDIVLLGHPDEAYSRLQTQLRREFAARSLVVMNIVNGHCGYLPPEPLFDQDIYAAWQTPFDRGCLERLIDASRTHIAQLDS